MAITKTETKIELSKEVELTIHETEENSVIVNVQGWRMRIYFDKDADKDKFRNGQTLLVKYFGDIENPHSIKFAKLK